MEDKKEKKLEKFLGLEKMIRGAFFFSVALVIIMCIVILSFYVYSAFIFEELIHLKRFIGLLLLTLSFIYFFKLILEEKFLGLEKMIRGAFLFSVALVIIMYIVILSFYVYSAFIFEELIHLKRFIGLLLLTLSFIYFFKLILEEKL
ncbi:hypothetical protein [Streptobacillus moniliformis]|uniref:hypothetical protein n=1 Tax=Streptobacillus moniliformis TaxID=34105 RepID=UPI0007E42737|nr:hypothetical protein [Streptobacillus moniliformis]